MSNLPREFYARPTLTVARDLLGRVLVRRLDGECLSGRIVEVEAYIGEADQASHARVGRTARNAAMYGPPGHAYVYLIYGVHYCLNLVTEDDGFPAAVLVRALEPLAGVEWMRGRRGDRPDTALTSGPGKLCQALAIDRRFDGADLCAAEGLLWVEDGLPLGDAEVSSGPRIGVRGDEQARGVPWRFVVRDSRCLSRGAVPIMAEPRPH